MAAARWLIDKGYTDSQRLVANASSIAGSLGGAVLNQHPELFGAALIDYAVFDLLRYPLWGQARYWTDEIGSPDEPSDFEVLRKISPLHNVKDGACYPATLLRPGELDPTVTAVHSYKFAARLQAAQGCARPVLLDIMEGAGHDFGTTPVQSAKSHAVALQFLAKTLPR